MRSTFVNRLRSNSIPLNTIPPPHASSDHSPELAALAARILYRSPLPSPSDLPIFVLDSAAFPAAGTEVYDELLPYVLARLPGEEELIGGQGYEVVFFAGGNSSSSYNTTTGPVEAEDADSEAGEGRRKKRPGFGWFLRAYNVLNRATRKKLQRLWIVHEKGWVRVLVGMFAAVVSPKFRKKVVHVSTLTALALYLPIEDVLIPPSAYLTDRRKLPDIFVPYASGRRAFGVRNPLPGSSSDELALRLPRVLRETTSFVLKEPNMKMEGIFRVSPRAQTVEILREAYDRGQTFIVWRDGGTLSTWPGHKEGHGDVAISDDDLDQVEGYDTHTAAALIKLWYKELHEPLFPQSSYQALRKFYENADAALEVTTLLQILAPGTEYSPITPMAMSILKLHLLPLLSRAAEHAESNKMTPSNLAVCFAPSLLRGPDPFEDVKISAIIRRILTAMIEHWKADLAPALGLTDDMFEYSLRLPDKVEDREDPLEEAVSKRSSASGQMSGIALLDNDHSTSEDDMAEDEDLERPPLPPRPRATTIPSLASDHQSNNSTINPIDPIRRKPAPPLHTPPRYSTIIPDQAAALARTAGSVCTDHPINTVSEEEPQDDNTRRDEEPLPQYEEHSATTDSDSDSDSGGTMSIPRKPVAGLKKGKGSPG